MPIHVSVDGNLSVSVNVRVFVIVDVHEVCDTADALRVCALPKFVLRIMYCMHSSKVSQDLDTTMVKSW